jgi:hypothetical protein
MGKASSAKKVARAARAGGNRRSGQRRAIGFPAMIAIVLILGLLLVGFARERRDANAFPRANQDHIHSSIDIYTCIVDTSAPAASDASTTTIPSSGSDTSTTASTDTTTSTTDTTTSTTDTTTPSTDTTTPSTDTTTPASDTTTTTIAPFAAGDVHGEYQPPPKDAQQDTLGIHTHGDGLMHIHPFADSVAGRKATLGVFLDQVGITMTDQSLVLSTGTFTEGQTKCEGGKDGQLQVAKWDSATDAAKGLKPDQIFTSDFRNIRLGANQSYVIAFMPPGSTIKAQPDVAQRIANVSDLGSSTTAPASSGAPSSDQGSTTTVPPAVTGSDSSAPTSSGP